MQDKAKEKELDNKKRLFKKAAGKVARKLRGKTGIITLYHTTGLPAPSLTKMEKGESDPQMTTICRLAHLHGLKCSEFIKLVEDELPEGFTFKM